MREAFFNVYARADGRQIVGAPFETRALCTQLVPTPYERAASGVRHVCRLRVRLKPTFVDHSRAVH